jgi:hypothetical protein
MHTVFRHLVDGYGVNLEILRAANEEQLDLSSIPAL